MFFSVLKQSCYSTQTLVTESFHYDVSQMLNWGPTHSMSLLSDYFEILTSWYEYLEYYPHPQFIFFNPTFFIMLKTQQVLHTFKGEKQNEQNKDL